MTDPLLLFLDEPTSPLDPQTVDDFLDIIKKLSDKGTTVIMVTHKPEDLVYMDEVIFMAEGGIWYTKEIQESIRIISMLELRLQYFLKYQEKVLNYG